MAINEANERGIFLRSSQLHKGNSKNDASNAKNNGMSIPLPQYIIIPINTTDNSVAAMRILNGNFSVCMILFAQTY